MRVPRFGATGLFLAAFLLFFAPWVSVSCGGVELANVSGWDLAWGNEAETSAGVGDNAGVDDEDDASATIAEESGGDPEFWALVALGASGVGLALVGLRGRRGALGRAVAGLVGGIGLIALQIKMEGDFDAAIAESASEDLDITTLVSLNWETAYWLALLAFLAAAGLQLFERQAVRKRLGRAVGVSPPVETGVLPSGVDSASPPSSDPMRTSPEDPA